MKTTFSQLHRLKPKADTVQGIAHSFNRSNPDLNQTHYIVAHVPIPNK
jgi:hypothetical protein